MKKLTLTSAVILAIFLNGLVFSTAFAEGEGDDDDFYVPKCIYHFDKIIFRVAAAPGILPPEAQNATLDIVVPTRLKRVTNIQAEIKHFIQYELGVPEALVPLVSIFVDDIRYQAENACDILFYCKEYSDSDYCPVR